METPFPSAAWAVLQVRVIATHQGGSVGAVDQSIHGDDFRQSENDPAGGRRVSHTILCYTSVTAGD